jgi:hypothetical protein
MKSEIVSRKRVRALVVSLQAEPTTAEATDFPRLMGLRLTGVPGVNAGRRLPYNDQVIGRLDWNFALAAEDQVSVLGGSSVGCAQLASL